MGWGGVGEGSTVCLKAMTEGAQYLKEGYKDCCRSKNIYKFVAVRVLHS